LLSGITNWNTPFCAAPFTASKRVASESKKTAVGIALMNDRLWPLPVPPATALPRSVAAAARY
jgi:hypothetical protein